MGRVWILAGSTMVVSILLFIFSGFVGTEGMLYVGMCIGAGAAAAYIQGTPGFGRAMYLFGGILIGGIGYVLGASVLPDTNVGLFIGAIGPQAIIAFAAMWSRRTEMFIAATIGSGAIAGVYATGFNIDPQSINVSLPIALGQTIMPVGLGYLAAVLARSFLGDDPPRNAAAGSDEPLDDENTASDEDSVSDETTANEAVDETQQMDLEETR